MSQLTFQHQAKSLIINHKSDRQFSPAMKISGY